MQPRVKGGLFTKEFNIKCDTKIYKISNSVFSYDIINYDNNFIKEICNLLDKGMKFVPIIFNNEFDHFNNLYNELDNTLKPTNTDQSSNNSSKNDSTVIQTTNSTSLSKLNSSSINYDKIPIQFETLTLRENIFKDTSNNKIKLENNLDNKQINILLEFKKKNPFVILQCDKNIGSMLISHDNLIKLANDHLSSSETYFKLQSNEINAICDKINSSLDSLKSNKNISKTIHDKLYLDTNTINEIQPGKFRVLPKLHKKEFGIRPIISCTKHPTRKLCILIDLIINPFIQKISHILKDSQQLLQIGQELKSKLRLFLYSCDFESLYTNIKPQHAIELISNYLYYNTKILEQFNIDLIGFRTILELIFTCNIFSFRNDFYLQRIGLPMGCICGSSVANIYIYILELKWLNLNPERLYYRFIDDIFIGSKDLIDEVNFKSNFLYLNLNIVRNDKVAFLDLEISFNLITNKLHFSLYIKPTNTFSYLLPSSNHPNHIFDNIPISLFKRIRRICTLFTDFLHFSRFLYLQLINRGYNCKKLKGIIRNISNIDRNSLLPYKQTENAFIKNALKLFFKYDKNYDFIKDYLYENFYNLSNDCTFLKNKQLVIINTVNLNIGSLLIHNIPLKKFSKFSYHKCNNINCNICKFSKTIYFFKRNNLFLPLQSTSNCNAIGIIYIIECKKCNLFYIGESGRSVKARLSEHLSNIKRFGKNLNNSLISFNSQSEVAIHFNESGHSYQEDFSFFIFKSNIFDDSIRKSIEIDLINFFNIFKIDILNEKQPHLSNMKYLTFQNLF